MAKEKKEKIVYVDDGRTIADMSGISGKCYTDPKTEKYGRMSAYSAPLKEKLTTLLDIMGFMLLPTLAICGILAAAFLIVYLIL